METDIENTISRNMRLLDELILNLQGIFLMSDDSLVNNSKLCFKVEKIVKDFTEKIKLI